MIDEVNKEDLNRYLADTRDCLAKKPSMNIDRAMKPEPGETRPKSFPRGKKRVRKHSLVPPIALSTGQHKKPRMSSALGEKYTTTPVVKANLSESLAGLNHKASVLHKPLSIPPSLPTLTTSNGPGNFKPRPLPKPINKFPAVKRDDSPPANILPMEKSPATNDDSPTQKAHDHHARSSFQSRVDNFSPEKHTLATLLNEIDPTFVVFLPLFHSAGIYRLCDFYDFGTSDTMHAALEGLRTLDLTRRLSQLRVLETPPLSSAEYSTTSDGLQSSPSTSRSSIFAWSMQHILYQIRLEEPCSREWP
ncbi:hypothetical protein MIND_01133200 [Mycena indigotica]|uniref:Uncharacterized protein n=1 Tax=Mycena indigotica TaxID=2126181 RepID=A0A8H6S689_9AGAR|nr:uncharacterized protein MIND_01133200 [Mycena indigotica]KAF7293548.1 hypothetical protein MIND_01133200 [Mycena indigotica]